MDPKQPVDCICGLQGIFVEGPYPLCRCPHPAYTVVCPSCNRTAYGASYDDALHFWALLTKAWHQSGLDLMSTE